MDVMVRWRTPWLKAMFMLQRPKLDALGQSAEHKSREPATSSLPEADMRTATDLESLLKIDVKTIYRYAQRGLIPYVRIQSNFRFRKREILEWIERQSYHS